MPITFPASPSDGDVYTNTTTGVKYIYNNADGVWKTQVFPTNTDYLQLTGGTLTGNLSLGTNDLTAQDINSTTLTTTGAVTVGNGLTVSAGNVVMSNGAGIDFSATADGSGMASELLDDYEEGTWTPNLIATGGSLSVSYTSRDGKYTKIGNICTVSFRMRVSSHSGGSGDYRVEGLPFNAVNAGNDHIGVSTAAYESHPISSTTQLIQVIDSNTNYIRMLQANNGGGWNAYTPSSQFAIYMSFTYPVS